MLHTDIKNGIKDAMKAHDANKLKTFRNMSAAFTNELVAKNKKPSEMLTDEEVLAVITKLAKQRRDSIDQYGKGGRKDLVEEEEAELAILETYLPKMMKREEVVKVVKEKKAELGIEDATKKGMLMAGVMKDLKGKADGAMVREVVDSLF